MHWLSLALLVISFFLKAGFAQHISIQSKSKQAPLGYKEWAVRAGSGPYSANGEAATSVATDRAGNIYVTGYFEGEADFGSETLTTTGNSDMFFSKYSPDGNLIWVKHIGYIYDNPNSATTHATGIAIDQQENIYVTGLFDGTIAFDSFKMEAKSSDMFLVKYRPNGAVEWAIQGGGKGEDNGTGVAVDSLGNIYVTGGFGGTMLAPAIFGEDTLVNSNKEYTIYVAKYLPSGKVAWARQLPVSRRSYGRKIAVDSFGSGVYITGSFQDTLFFKDELIIAHDKWLDALIAKLDSAGEFQWCTRLGNSFQDDPSGIAVGSQGSIYISLEFGADGDSASIGLSKLTQNGDVDWFRTIKGQRYTAGTSVALDAQGFVYQVGEFGGTVNFDEIQLSSKGINDIFIAKYTDDGEVVWARRAGGDNTYQFDAERGFEITLDKDASIISVGSFYDTADFAGNVLAAAGGSDIFIWKSSGEYSNVVPIETSISTRINRLSLDPVDKLICVDVNAVEEENISLTAVDLLGRTVLVYSGKLSVGSNKVGISAATLCSGSYMLLLSGPKSRDAIKFLVL